MNNAFKGKCVVLGVSGSISAYKAVDLASKLTQASLEVNVIMTRSAEQFVTALTFRSITQRPVVVDMFSNNTEYSVEHIALAERADIVVVAPATANIIAKIASGISDEMVTCTVLASRAPVLLAPAMDVGMYQNPVTQDNLARLRSRGLTIVGPGQGRMASGLVGMGRLISNDLILGSIYKVLGKKGDLAGKRIVVSAGGTKEPIDPVRYVGNRSSGKMGYAVAAAARDRGADVTLITTPTSLTVPAGMDIVNVETAQQMHDAVLKAAAGADALVMVAAVADYRPEAAAAGKIKRQAEKFTLDLVKTPDIVGSVPGNIVKVGFAAESSDLIDHARKKLAEKKLDLIAVNDITAQDSGFGVDTNRVTLIDREGHIEELPLMLKSEVASRILDRLAKLLAQKR